MSKPEQTLDDGKGKESIKKLADFFDCGLFLLYCRQGDKPSEKGKSLVEAVTADKIFRLLHKLSTAICKEGTSIGDIPHFDIRVGSDLNGMHGKGIAFPLKNNAFNAGISDEEINELDVNEIPQRYSNGQGRSHPLFSLKAIEHLEGFLPEQVRRISGGRLSDGREAYSSTVSYGAFKEWRENGRFHQESTDLISAFKGFINRLEDRELICLGRHENVEKTVEAIRYLFNRWKNISDNALKRVEELHKNNKWSEKEEIDIFKKLYNYSQEMIYKSEADKEYYEKAYEELKKETYPALKKLLENQSPADNILGYVDVKQYVYFGYLLHAFTSFLFLALAAHPPNKYYIPPYIITDINYELLPSLVDKILKEDRMTKISYSSENYQKTIRSLSASKSTNDLFDFDNFRKGNLSVYLNYLKTTQSTILQEYTRFIGGEKRRIESQKEA